MVRKKSDRKVKKMKMALEKVNVELTIEEANNLFSFNQMLIGYGTPTQLVTLIDALTTGATNIVTPVGNIVKPLWLSSYRLTKRAIESLTSPTSWLFKQWLAGTIMYCMVAFIPSVLSDLILGSGTWTEWIVLKIIGVITVPNWLQLGSIIGYGYIFNKTVPFFETVTDNVAGLLGRVISAPIEYVDETIGETMYQSWKSGGWKHVALTISKGLAAAVSLWLLSDSVFSFARSAGLVQGFYDLWDQFAANSLVLTFVDSSPAKAFIKSIQLAISFLGLDVDITQLFTLESIITRYCDITLGTSSKDTCNIVAAMSVLFGGTSVANVMNGLVQKQTGTKFSLDANILAYSLSQLTGEGESIDTFANKLKSNSSIGDPLYYWNKLAARPLIERIIGVIQSITFLVTQLTRTILNDHLGQLCGLAIACMVIGSASYINTIRQPMDLAKLNLLVDQTYANAQVADALAHDPIEWDSIMFTKDKGKLLPRQLNYAIYDNLKDDAMKLVVENCTNLTQYWVKLAASPPSRNMSNTVFTQLMPNMVKITNLANDKMLLAQSGITPSESKIEPRVERALINAAKKVL